MAKRLTDNMKWNKVWFRKLTPVEKCFWMYITDNCNHAGIWEVDFETAEHFIGSKIKQHEVKQTFSKQILEIDEGKRWFIKDFIDFQYNTTINNLNPSNKVHASVLSILKKHSIIEEIEKEGAKKGLTSPLESAKDMDMDREMDKEINMDGGLEKLIAYWNSCLDTPKLLEKEFIKELYEKFGFEKTKKLIREFAEGKFYKISTMREALTAGGNIKPKLTNRSNGNNGKQETTEYDDVKVIK